MSKLFRKSKKGFTLVELIVVIAIIGVLAAIIVPTTLHFVNEARVEAANQEASGIFNALDGSMTLAIASGDNIDDAKITAMLAELEISKTDNTVTVVLSYTAGSGTSPGEVKMVLTTSGDTSATYEKSYPVTGASSPLQSSTGYTITLSDAAPDIRATQAAPPPTPET